MGTNTSGKTLQSRVDSEYAGRVHALAQAKGMTDSDLIRQGTDAIMLETDVDQLIAEELNRHKTFIAQLNEFREWQQQERARRQEG